MAYALGVAESFLIALREGFEAALIVAIVMAYVHRRAPQMARAVWIGTLSALAIAAGAGIVLDQTLGGLTGQRRLRTFAIICFAAAVTLTWMIFWMRKQSRTLKGELEGKAGKAVATGSGVALGLVAFTAVLREGLETSLFLISTTSASDGSQVAAGTILGLLGAMAMGFVVYRGGRRINMRVFFVLTGFLLVIFAAGLADRGVMFLQATGDLGSQNMSIYDVTRFSWLTTDTQAGRFLAGIFGWDPRPSVEQLGVYLLYAVPVGALFLKGAHAKPPARPAPVPVA